MKASIIICTHNRVDFVKSCLASLDEFIPSERDAEVILVNNASTDDTKRFESYRSRLFDFKFVSEPRVGLSHARNCGLAAASGEVTIFIDDDAKVTEGWLSQILLPFSDHDADIVGGEVIPIWQGGRPEWLHDSYLGFFSAGLNWSEDTKVLSPGEWVLECNVAVKTDLLREAGGFNASLGRSGSSLVSGEGIIFDQLREGGARAVYAPHAKVEHLIHEDRLTKSWLLRRSFAQGISTAIISEFYPRTRDIPNVEFNLQSLHLMDFDSLDAKALQGFVVYFDRLGYVLKKKGLC